MTLRIAWFATAKGQSSRKLLNAALEAIARAELDAEIVCVVCNRELGQSANTDAFLRDAEQAGIPLIAKSSRDWRQRVRGEISNPGEPLAPWRRDYDQHLYEQILECSPDIAMLAGYMMVITDAICERLPCLNLHPALPDGPIGTWQEVIHQLIAEQAESSGMVLQRVTTELDRGPTITSARYSIRGPQFDELWAEFGADAESETPLFHAIREAGVSRESIFILQSLRAISAGQTPLGATGLPADGFEPGSDITAAVEAELGRAHR